ncbi:MAG: carboxylating nicotinate-nucleotide diphosphorylase [Nitrospirae bacterium]|nr:carboxylating nicotinate-nucleotide diphosphorylase [Candidatus Troglogloeales bacterium]
MAEYFLLKEIVEMALAEDIVYGDKTTDAIFPRPVLATGKLIAKETLIVAGLELFQTVFSVLDPQIQFEVLVAQGKEAKEGACIGRVTGDGRALLKGERTALNFLQHLSGIATLTHQFVVLAAEGAQRNRTLPAIVDTRKTTPGLRVLEKEAVLLGGGLNHRFHLGDLVLIKDNHIALAKGIANAVRATRATLSHPLKIEVEVTNIKEAKEAIKSGADIIMLDNMSIPEIESAVALIRKTAPLTPIEVSGGINLKNVARVAQCGVDMISIGAITHSAPAVDISLEITDDKRNRVKRSKAI